MFQLVPHLQEHDALGTHSRLMAEMLGPLHGGFIVENASPALRHLATPFKEAEVGANDVLVYHMALASQVGEWMTQQDSKKVLDYHNITPWQVFRAYEAGLANALRSARLEIMRLRNHISTAITHSEFSRKDLTEAGYRRTETIPVLIDFDAFERSSNQDLESRLLERKDKPGDILFLGRIAPNKGQEDLIKTFAIYRRCYNPRARLFIVGGSNSPFYSQLLDTFIARLGIDGVHLTGDISTEDLVTYFGVADLFLSMSEHEGFGVPWLEAMHFQVPVLTFGAGAIPETVGDAAVIFREKKHDEVAAMIHLLMEDELLRSQLISSGLSRVEEMRPERFRERLLRLFQEIE